MADQTIRPDGQDTFGGFSGDYTYVNDPTVTYPSNPTDGLIATINTDASTSDMVVTFPNPNIYVDGMRVRVYGRGEDDDDDKDPSGFTVSLIVNGESFGVGSYESSSYTWLNFLKDKKWAPSELDDIKVRIHPYNGEDTNNQVSIHEIQILCQQWDMQTNIQGGNILGGHIGRGES